MTIEPPLTQLTRDLIWVINSESLIEHGCELARVSEEQIDADRLRRFFAEGVPRRVGHYFERLVLFWLRHVRHVDVVAHGMPIRDGKRTLGEIDFLYRDEDSRLTHLEVAVKFYLHHGKSKIHGSHFIGPNVKDTFERKMDRLFGHQLPLSGDHVDGIQAREALVKGRIFYEVGIHSNRPAASDQLGASHSGASIDLPDRMSADHTRCQWIGMDDFERMSVPETSRFRILAKPFWLAPEIASRTKLEGCEERIGDGGATKSAIGDLIRATIDRRNQPVLIAELKPGWQPESPSWVEHLFQHEHEHEVRRIFVVPDGWPLG